MYASRDLDRPCLPQGDYPHTQDPTHHASHVSDSLISSEHHHHHHHPPPSPSSLIFRPIEPSYLIKPIVRQQPAFIPSSPPSLTHSSLSPSPCIHGPSSAPILIQHQPLLRRNPSNVVHTTPSLTTHPEWVMWVGNVPLNATYKL